MLDEPAIDAGPLGPLPGEKERGGEDYQRRGPGIGGLAGEHASQVRRVACELNTQSPAT